MRMFAFKVEVRAKKCPCKNKTVQQTVISINQSFKVLSTGMNIRTYALSLGRHRSMALSITLRLNSAQTETIN